MLSGIKLKSVRQISTFNENELCEETALKFIEILNFTDHKQRKYNKM